MPFLTPGAMPIKEHCPHTVPGSSEQTADIRAGLSYLVLPGKDSAAATGERVGMLLPENVAHAAARDDL